MIQKITKFRRWWEKLGLEDLKSLRIGLIIIIIADIFGIWWFLGWRKIAILIFIFSLAFLVVIVIYERRLETMEEQKKLKKEEKKDLGDQIQDSIDETMKSVDEALNPDLGF